MVTAMAATVHKARIAPTATLRGVVVRREVRSENLGEVTPFGDEDHDERGRDHLPASRGFALDRFGFVLVTAMTTCTTNALAAPSHTARGRPRDARTSDANIVLLGSSPKKITGNTARMIAGFIGDLFLPGEGNASVPSTTALRKGCACAASVAGQFLSFARLFAPGVFEGSPDLARTEPAMSAERADR